MSNTETVANGVLGSYPVRVTTTVDGQIQHVTSDNAFAPARYDEIALGYTGSNLTSVIYKLAGATVGTLTLSYTGADLTGAARS